MATDKNIDTETQTLAEKLAFEIFKTTPHAAGNAEKCAMQSFRAAKAFLEVQTQLSSGKLNIYAIDDNPLDDAFAPNLKRNHPINLMSKEWGSLEKVKKVMKDLDENPTASTYETYGWGPAEVMQARTLFPFKLEKIGKA